LEPSEIDELVSTTMPVAPLTLETDTAGKRADGIFPLVSKTGMFPLKVPVSFVAALPSPTIVVCDWVPVWVDRLRRSASFALAVAPVEIPLSFVLSLADRNPATVVVATA
jgi:hypothetical protein